MKLLYFAILILNCFSSRSTVATKCLMPTHSCPALATSNQTKITVNTGAMSRCHEPITSCKDLAYTDQALLQLPDGSPPFWVLCVHKHKGTGGGWLVIQQRVSGKVSFFRNWMDYRQGFGVLDDEFWLGLEIIHRVTRLHHYELLVEMTDFEGNYKFARYTRFEIAGEDEEYALHHLGSYSGSAGDSLRPHVGMKFSTYDNDNDLRDTQNCAMSYSSGWWFSNCFMADLNGMHVKSEDASYSINWYGFSNKFQSLKYTRMMLRMVN